MASPIEQGTIEDVLIQHFPTEGAELRFHGEYQALTALILAGNTSDAQVNELTPGLWSQYTDYRALAGAQLPALEEMVYSVGYFRTKARRLVAAARYVLEHWGGRLPATLNQLLEIPGIGPKSASVILYQVHGLPALIVDTHVGRCASRLGLVAPGGQGPRSVEKGLALRWPRNHWSQLWGPLTTALNRLGAQVCVARKPRCSVCPLSHLCPRVGLAL